MNLQAKDELDELHLSYVIHLYKSSNLYKIAKMSF